GDCDLRERRRGQLDRRVQRQRRELLALGLLHRLGLLLGELAQAPEEVLRVAPERESEAAAFHGMRLAASRALPAREAGGGRQEARETARPERRRRRAAPQRSGSLYRSSTSRTNASTTPAEAATAPANGDSCSPSASSSVRVAAPTSSRYAGDATRGGAPIARSSASAASCASSIPGGRSTSA